MTAETTVKTPRGASFPVAAGWTVTEAGDQITLSDPEHQMKVTYVELEAPSGASAIAGAWKRHDPAFALTARRTVTPPSTTWDDVTQTVYETPDPAAVVMAVARRRGQVAWVVLLEATQASLDRRGAQMQNSFDRLEAPGVAKESFAGKTAATLDEARTRELREFAERARVALHVPGAAFVVVQGGKPVVEAALGVRELGKPEAVTPKTLFLIGSTTKSLTTLLMAKAVDEGKFTWDTRVKEVDPSFTLGDAALTERVSMQHLVCACTGVPRTDMELLFTFGRQRPEDLLGRLRELRPTTAFGETFQYNNQLVAAAGFLTARAYYPKLSPGDAYDRALREKVLTPLGMSDSTLSLRDGKARAAATHGEGADGEMRVMPFSYEEFLVPLRPSGGLLSSVGDMARYLQAELAQGKSVTGVQVASAENVVRRRKPQVKVTDDVSYGMGLMSGKVKDVPFVEHGGATFGHRSTFFYLPDQNVGLVVLASAPGPLGSLIKTRLLELLFDAKPSAESTLAFVVAEQKKSVEKFREQLAPAEPAEVTRALLGRYSNDRLGEVTVGETKGELWFDAGEWKSRLAWQKRPDGKKDLVLLDPPVAGLSFELREENGKRVIFLSHQQHEYVFRR